MFYSSPTTAEPPFPFNQRRVAVSTANQFNNEDTAFKFDSRLIIVEEKEESYEDDGQDSGIDSEDLSSVSPGSTYSSISSPPLYSPTLPPSSTIDKSQDEPLSLVVKDRSNALTLPISTSTPKHWKKSISRHYQQDTSEESHTVNDVTLENVENNEDATSAVQALLSLSKPRISLPISNSLRASDSTERFIHPVSNSSIVIPSASLSSSEAFDFSLPAEKKIKLSSPPSVPTQHFIVVKPVVTNQARYLPVQQQSIPSRHVYLPQQPAPLKEVQSNIQLSSNPSRLPFSIASITTAKSSPTFSWTPSPMPQITLMPENKAIKQEPMYLPSSFSVKNTEDIQIDANSPFFCLECKISFSTEALYQKHQEIHSSSQPSKQLSCKYCQKSYNSQSALKMHIRTHTLPCKCPECGKSFSRPWLLQGHMRTHTGEKPFACTHCTRSFADKSNLRAHLQTHLQNKKYSCAGCGKSFSRISLLSKHTEAGCEGLQTRNEECVETKIGLSVGQIRT